MAADGRGGALGHVVRAGLVAVTLAAGVGLAAIPVGNWFDQREELAAAKERRAQLEQEITRIRTDIDRLVGPEGLDETARCRSFYVEVGEELYAVPGLRGCVTDPTG